MPYASHLRLTVSGTVEPFAGQVLERWSYRLNLSNPGNVETPMTDDTRWNDVLADVRAFHTNPAAGIGTAAKLTEIKCAEIGPTGQYVGDARVSEEASLAGGGTSAVTHPLQIALVVSLQTGQRGGSKRGRFYLPLPTAGVQQDGLISTANRDNVQTAAAAFINALNDWPGIDLVGPKVTIASIKGYNTDVTGVTVGRVLDTLRSRRRSVPEEYTPPTAIT